MWCVPGVWGTSVLWQPLWQPRSARLPNLLRLPLPGHSSREPGRISQIFGIKRKEISISGCRAISEAFCMPQENGDIFEALKTMSAYFLRADAHSICQCIQAFGLNDLLFSIVRLERLFARSRETSPVRRELTNTGGHYCLAMGCGPYHKQVV